MSTKLQKLCNGTTQLQEKDNVQNCKRKKENKGHTGADDVVIVVIVVIVVVVVVVVVVGAACCANDI